MEYIKYGNAGIEVSRICLGAMTIYERLPESEAIGLVHECLDGGINFIDTADSYGRGESERFLAKALKGRRDQVIVSSKAWASRYAGRSRSADCSRRHLIDALNASLQRLETDYVDIYMCHHPDPLTSFEEVYSTLDNLVKQGKIRYVAMCNAYAWQVAYCLGVCARHGWEPPVSVQVHYNLLDRSIENETMPMANRLNVVLQSYGPQSAGLLTGKFRRGEPLPEDTRVAQSGKLNSRLTEGMFDFLEEMERIAVRNNATMAQLAVAWVRSRPAPFVPIVGASKPEHILPLLGVSELQIAPEDLDRLTELTEEQKYQPFYNQPMATAPAAGPNWL
jgi:aryl-alcohol dehydrogenase-like predicted oxidoreductase